MAVAKYCPEWKEIERKENDVKSSYNISLVAIQKESPGESKGVTINLNATKGLSVFIYLLKV